MCVHGSHFFVPTVTFKQLIKAGVLKFHIWIPYKSIYFIHKKSNLYFFLFRVISHFGDMAL